MRSSIEKLEDAGNMQTTHVCPALAQRHAVEAVAPGVMHVTHGKRVSFVNLLGIQQLWEDVIGAPDREGPQELQRNHAARRVYGRRRLEHKMVAQYCGIFRLLLHSVPSASGARGHTGSYPHFVLSGMTRPPIPHPYAIFHSFTMFVILPICFVQAPCQPGRR